ncbi:hypothetical protein [Chromobacterium vaccinii]|uniref:hypothetical protein n=1 Tax=Chromobacterium piscinae TaxID=686831 RepID=UPI001C8B5D47|nr:hypothetical protein [Chromobacterium vaccinii]MBX9358445.1 hypothetical protein [Chromobacterium vaccinii]
MKLFWIILLFISCNAIASDRISYCNGIFTFIPPKTLDINFIKKQSKLDNCKSELTVKLKNGKKAVKLSFPSESNQLNATPPTKEVLDEIKGKSAEIIYQSYFVKHQNGDVKVDTFIKKNKDGSVESIEKDFYFSKKDTYSIYAAYKANPDDMDDAAMLNSLERFFLSLQVNWN